MNVRRQAAASGRAEVLAAAVRAIVSLGYYRASSNAIARHAGVSWGTIQHHFGTREGLMLAVLEDSVDQIVAEVSRTLIIGDDLRSRLHSLLGSLTDFCSTQSYSATLQIMWNLGVDEQTQEETRVRLIEASSRVDDAYRELAAKVSPDLDTELLELSRKLAWGLGVNLATQTITRDYDEVERKRQRIESLDELVDVIAIAAQSRQRNKK